jgi:hypothetical protein
MVSDMNLSYRLLDVEKEWPQIEQEFIERGVPLPDPRFAMIMGAFEETTQILQGFLVCQLQFHFEPIRLYCRHALRGLVHAMEEELKTRAPGAQYFAFADTDHIAGICGAMGLEPMPMTIFQKRLPLDLLV